MKTQIIILVSILTTSTAITAQQYYYQDNINAIIVNHQEKTGGIGLNYNISIEIFGAMFHYPEIEFYYNFSSKFSTYGSFNFNILPSVENHLFGNSTNLKNNNFGYTLAGVLLGKSTFWFLTGYEISIGITHKKLNINRNSEERILENYNSKFLQFNFLKNTEYKNSIYSVKLSKIDFYKVINIDENNIATDYSDNLYNSIKKPLLVSISYTTYQPLSYKNLHIKFQFGLSFADEYGVFLTGKTGVIYLF